MDDLDEETIEEGRELYRKIEEAAQLLKKLHNNDITPQEDPNIWSEIKEGIELARQSAQDNEAIQNVIDEDIADSAEEFVDQVTASQSFEDVYPEPEENRNE